MISRSLYPLFLPIIQKIVVVQDEFRVASFYSFPFFFCISFLRDLLQNHNVLRIVLNCLVFFYTSSIRDCLSYASTPLPAFPVSCSHLEMGSPFLERESVNGKRESDERDECVKWVTVWCLIHDVSRYHGNVVLIHFFLLVIHQRMDVGVWEWNMRIYKRKKAVLTEMSCFDGIRVVYEWKKEDIKQSEWQFLFSACGWGRKGVIVVWSENGDLVLGLAWCVVCGMPTNRLSLALSVWSLLEIENQWRIVPS